MMYPLVLDLADDGFPVAVTCRVLGFSTQAFNKWRRDPVSQRDWDEAHVINAAIDIHDDDPAFGYRFISDELADAGFEVSERRVWRLCSRERIWSVFAKKKGLSRKAGPPVHDDLVGRDFSAERPNALWLTDITEHRTAWIPAIVATPHGGDGDGWSEVHQEAKGAVLRSDRQRWNGQSGGKVSGRASRGCLHMAAQRWPDDAASDTEDLYRRRESGVLLSPRRTKERVSGGSRARVPPGDLLCVGTQGGDLHERGQESKSAQGRVPAAQGGGSHPRSGRCSRERR
jgi:putative transposase